MDRTQCGSVGDLGLREMVTPLGTLFLTAKASQTFRTEVLQTEGSIILLAYDGNSGTSAPVPLQSGWVPGVSRPPSSPETRQEGERLRAWWPIWLVHLLSL